MSNINPPIPVAQYLRMSTDDQPNSIAIQKEAIQHYAAAHGLEVVATYSDEGKSGLQIRNRRGLRQLLSDVLDQKRQFKEILVYDVSRWGRFQDTDESAHYEFLCRRAGIPVRYCAELFDNDGKLPNAIMKALKRTMAAEFSRELSVKIRAAHCHIAEKGYHVGGMAAYGLQRMLITTNGRKRLLHAGECKNLTSDHVVLVPGPKKEVECVRTIFELAAKKDKCARAIAEELNRRRMLYRNNQRWDCERVYRVLKNEKYLGRVVWGVRDEEFHGPVRRRPRSAWIVKPGVFPALVTAEQFAMARKETIRRSNKKKPDSFHLEQLTKNLPKKGDSLETLRRKCLRRHRYSRRFGDILRAYELIGYKTPLKVIHSRTNYLKIQNLRMELFDQLTRLFPHRLRMVHGVDQMRFRILEVDNCWRIAVYICRLSQRAVSGEPIWLLEFNPQLKHLPALICIPTPELTRLTRYYFVRDLGTINTKFKNIRSGHPWLGPENRVRSLSDFCRMASRVLENNPPVAMPSPPISIVGDVVLTKGDPIITIDGNEIRLNRVNAAIFRLLLRNAGRVVPRRMIARFPTKRNREIYVNAHVGAIRKALGPQFKDRILTVKTKGYMYNKPSLSSTI